ncbi:hypothetical protein [Gordonia sp. N1V]|uniref:hypothetical protein n=1 Tax=Gordonia sp. N1V TaxID=3034163 RepID=UPI0023E09ABF|nr:hypothetical protein [Gordonia sp. N1V]MDF3280939.1 hypothetical protein [Gordonia sp. N1V]
MNAQLIVELATAFGSVGGGSLISFMLDRRSRKQRDTRNQSLNQRDVAQRDSINVATSISLLNPIREESERRLERIAHLKRVIRRVDDYLDQIRDLAMSRGCALPEMPADLRQELDELEE